MSEINQAEPKTYSNPLDQWFFTTFLEAYGKRERVEPARKLLHIHKPPMDVLDKIYQWVISDNQHRRRCKELGIFRPERPNCYTFFNEARWQDELPVIDRTGKDTTYNAPARLCNGDVNCLGTVIWCNEREGKNLCMRHYEKIIAPKVVPPWLTEEAHMKRLESLGLLQFEEETNEQYRERLRVERARMVKRMMNRFIGRAA